jgi:phosphate-selective porin OprO/OprP
MKHWMTTTLVMCTVAAAAGAEPTPAPGTEERLQRLEQEIRDLRDSRLKLQSDLGVDGKSSAAFARAGGKEAALKLGGLLQVQADGGDKGDKRFGSDNERFYLRRARLNATASFQEDFEARMETELAGSLSEANAMRAQLTDGYLLWKAHPEFQVQAGQFKTPFGYEQLASDPRLSSIERSLGGDRLTLGRQVGAQLAGDLLDQRVRYAGGLFNGTSVNSSSNDNSKFTLAGRLSAVPLAPAKDSTGARLGLGINGYFSDDDQLSGLPGEFKFNTSTNKAADNVFTGERAGWGADAQFSVSRFELWSEYLSSRYEPDNRVPDGAVDAEAWYAQATWYFLPNRLQGLVKHDTFDPNTDAGKDRTDTWTIGLNVYIRDHDLKLQFDYLSSDLQSTDTTEEKYLARLQAIF